MEAENADGLKRESGRVMQKIGMVYEGRLHKYSFNNDGELIDVDVYAIINDKI